MNLKLFALVGLLLSFASHADVVRLGQTELIPFDRGIRFTPIPGVCGLTSVKLAVRGEAANIGYVAVRFGNGDEQRLPLSGHFEPGRTSGWSILAGGPRCVAGFYLGGSAARAMGDAVVELYGNRTNFDLGGVNLDYFNGSSRYAPLKQTCGLRSVMVRVTQDSADIDYLAIRFANGDIQRLELRDFFEPNSASVWKDLNGDTRCVTGFYIAGRAGSFTRNSHIEIYGDIYNH